ncbi:MAG: flagellin [Phycisphaeraceae bacterium]|nr:flagellin [Phycisphaeraceae bacterium]
MARINTNVPSVIAQENLKRTQSELGLRLERLSTGLKINRGKDDPAGLIVSERIRSNINGLEASIKNSERAGSMLSTTESALAEVNDLLNSIRSLVVEAANTGANSATEREANQLQIDSAIESITRISNTASFGSLKLLNGSLDYTLSGLSGSAITTAAVRNASFLNAASLKVEVDVVASAQVGALYYNGSTTPPGVTLSSMTLEVAGPRGVQVLTIASGQPLAKVVEAVNNLTSLTGIQASLINNTAASGMVFQSSEFGSDAFVSVKRIGGPGQPDNSWNLYKFADNAPVPSATPFAWSALISSNTLVSAERDDGKDVLALVNGNLATGRGLNLSINSPSLGLDILLSRDHATRPSATPTEFYITGGGALFQLGPDVSAAQQATTGIPSMAASRLGATLLSGEVQYLSSLKTGQRNSIAESVRRGNFADSTDILNKAIEEVTGLRGRLGAFERNVLETNRRSLQSQFENLTASDSAIRDADFAFETSRLTRAQILSSAGTSTLTLANQQAQQVLQLLG